VYQTPNEKGVATKGWEGGGGGKVKDTLVIETKEEEKKSGVARSPNKKRDALKRGHFSKPRKRKLEIDAGQKD